VRRRDEETRVVEDTHIHASPRGGAMTTTTTIIIVSREVDDD